MHANKKPFYYVTKKSRTLRVLYQSGCLSLRTIAFATPFGAQDVVEAQEIRPAQRTDSGGKV